jgi:ABC-2 type transport system permease protein
MTPLPLWRAYLHALLLSAEMVYRDLARDLFVLFTIVIQPALVAFMALWMLKDSKDGYGIFVVVGGGMTGLWSSLLFLCGNAIGQDRWEGVLETLVGVPTPLSVITLGRTGAFVLQSLVSMVVSYILAALVLGYPLSIEQPGFFALSLGLMVIAFICFGLAIAPFFLLNPIVQRFQNGLEFPVFILSGFLFPIALLPGWTTPISYLLAPYWAAQALHASAQGSATWGELGGYWALLLGLGLGYLLLSTWLFKVMLYRVRVEATLDVQ